MQSRLETVVEGGPTERADGFEAFFEAERTRLFGTLCLVTGDRVDAEDVMQEAFLKVWERWDRVAGADDPTAYPYRTAFNVFRSRLRRTSRAARWLLAAERLADPFPAVEERHDLLVALRTLTPRQRAAVVLMDLMDLTLEDAAHILHVRPVTVRVWFLGYNGIEGSRPVRLTLYDPVTDVVSELVALGEGNPVAMAVAPDSVWILNHEGTLTRVDLIEE
jgi:RNA polymerase sigma factor (sigma-70 family)